MKKLITLLSIMVLMTSCSLFNKDDEKVEVITPAPVEVNTEDGETRDSSTTDDANTGDTETQADDIDTDIKIDVDGSMDTAESDEEVVEEFEKELDALFELLENEE